MPATNDLPINCCYPAKEDISSAIKQLKKANLQDLTAYQQKRLRLMWRPVWSYYTHS
ncbi:hypothetical protein DPMN_058991 [Dreissena polymorpha]|uniref:Uncharacterized protein n=1 Tax=Dreissena polymorpha TaxID=45954 RepID=A0A9D4C349_DREPO|nr:hypothetical protein DPMN_058991 [Dreissena polymorpha]